MIAARATSDQLIYSKVSIFRFNSVGTAKVNDAIISPPVYYVFYVYKFNIIMFVKQMSVYFLAFLILSKQPVYS